MTEYRGATKVPAKMYDKLIRLAQTYPSPKQFYEHAVELGKQYGIHENDLVRWGLIDAHHKPQSQPERRSLLKLYDEAEKIHRQIPPGTGKEISNQYTDRETCEQTAKDRPVTEEDIVRGHRATKKEKKP